MTLVVVDLLLWWNQRRSIQWLWMDWGACSSVLLGLGFPNSRLEFSCSLIWVQQCCLNRWTEGTPKSRWVLHWMVSNRCHLQAAFLPLCREIKHLFLLFWEPSWWLLGWFLCILGRCHQAFWSQLWDLQHDNEPIVLKSSLPCAQEQQLGTFRCQLPRVYGSSFQKQSIP